MTVQEQNEFIEKVNKGLEISFKKLLEENRLKGTKIVVMQGDKIVHLTPDEYEASKAIN